MGTAWLYLVGDDPGSVSSDSNNNGLGYMVSPEGEKSSFLEDFTTHARKLIKKGTGSFTTASDSADKSEKIAKSYVVADSFLNSDSSSSNGYVGVFALLATKKVWDNTLTTNQTLTGEEANDEPIVLNNSLAVLPINTIITYSKNEKDCKTIRDQILADLEKNKKSIKYNKVVNTFGVEYAKNIEYNKDAYKSLWKDADKK